MSQADALLRAGDLDGVRAALVEIVRAKPADEQARMFLFQLLCVTGEWDKARVQLLALAQLSPEAQMLSVAYNQVIDAERQRALIFKGAAEMPLLIGQDGWAQGVARGISLLSKGDFGNAIAARNEAFDNAPDMPGMIDGQHFVWLADADGRFGPTFEAVIAGRYGLVPFDQVASIKSEGPRDLRDTVWYPVQIAFRNGQSVAAFLPARYPGSEASANAAEKLGRMTSWTDREWGQEGSGQRLWMFSDGEDRGLLELHNIVFD